VTIDEATGASEQSDLASDLLVVAAQREADLVEVRQPLVLISQAPRSGGTLMMRLFDGHPSCHTIGHELSARLWRLKAAHADDPDTAWERVYDGGMRNRFLRGHRQSHKELNRTREQHPFLLPPSLHRRLFDLAFARFGDGSPRSVLDSYFTAYFNGWLNNQNLNTGRSKQWITGFTPRLLVEPEYMPRFWIAYPDGRLISIVRNPRSWYVSARAWSNEWRRIDRSIAQWRESVSETIRVKAERPDQVHIVAFEDLVKNTEKTMRRAAKFLGLPFDPALLEPTFNRTPITANSSFPVRRTGMLNAPVHRDKEQLTTAELKEIDALAGDLPEQARDLIRGQR
jgi:Sulfotransferase family